MKISFMHRFVTQGMLTFPLLVQPCLRFWRKSMANQLVSTVLFWFQSLKSDVNGNLIVPLTHFVSASDIMSSKVVQTPVQCHFKVQFFCWFDKSVHQRIMKEIFKFIFRPNFWDFSAKEQGFLCFIRIHTHSFHLDSQHLKK